MATVVINTENTIQFVNGFETKNQDAPTLSIQVGDWTSYNGVQSGVVFDVTGEYAPLLTADNARKLSKWLAKAADALEGVKTAKNKSAKRRYQEEDDDNFYVK